MALNRYDWMMLLLTGLIVVVGLVVLSDDYDTPSPPPLGRMVTQVPVALVSGMVFVDLSAVPPDPEPRDRVALQATVRNGLIDEIRDVKAIVLTDPVNLGIRDRDVWKSVAIVLKNGDEDDIKWRMTVKDWADFVPNVNPEVLRVRVKYQTSVRAANKFTIMSSTNTPGSAKHTTTASLVPIAIEVDPKEVPLDPRASIAITVTVKKTNSGMDGLLEDRLRSLKIILPGIDDFDLSKVTCTYGHVLSARPCTLTKGGLTLRDVPLHTGKTSVKITLPLVGANLNQLRGTERAVIVSLDDVWLYQDRDIDIHYSLNP